MKTIYLNNEYHLVAPNGKTVCNMECLLLPTTETQQRLFDINDRAPTCLKCIEQGFRDYREKENDFNILLGGLDFLVKSHCKHYNQITKEEKEGSFPFIPSSAKRLFSDFKDIKEHLKKETRWSGNHVLQSFFLDAGCGIGNVLLIAKMRDLCTYRHGIEFFDETADKAETWLNSKSSAYDLKIIRKDILKFGNYHKYDIIYFYRPFMKRKLQTMFEERLENRMKVGAVLLANSKQSESIIEDYRFEQLDLKVNFAVDLGGVYIKTRSGRRKTPNSMTRNTLK